MTEGCGTVAGYAVTAQIRSAQTPILGHTYLRHTEWWSDIEAAGTPRIVVIEDTDLVPGYGACVGQVAAAAFGALGCRGAVTNGSGRDIDALSKMGFALFAASVSPSRAYAHVVAHSCEVDIFGLRVRPGDLLAADRHGVLLIPPHEALRVCEAAAELVGRKRTFVEFCSSPDFSLNGLKEQLDRFHS